MLLLLQTTARCILIEDHAMWTFLQCTVKPGVGVINLLTVDGEKAKDRPLQFYIGAAARGVRT